MARVFTGALERIEGVLTGRLVDFVVENEFFGGLTNVDVGIFTI